MSFDKELEIAFQREVVGNVDAFVRKIAARCHQAVTSATPVGNRELWQSPKSAPQGYTGGHARRNWLVDVDVVNAVEKNGEDFAANEAAAQAEIRTFSIASNVQINLHNSAPYIGKLNDGSSTQAPAGFVERAVAAAGRTKP